MKALEGRTEMNSLRAPSAEYFQLAVNAFVLFCFVFQVMGTDSNVVWVVRNYDGTLTFGKREKQCLYSHNLRDYFFIWSLAHHTHIFDQLQLWSTCNLDINSSQGLHCFLECPRRTETEILLVFVFRESNAIKSKKVTFRCQLPLTSEYSSLE